MDSGSRAATVGDGAANFTAARLLLDLLNASSPPTWWDSSPPREGTGLGEQQRLVREQAYRDFTTTIQVFILIGSLLGKLPRTNTRIVHTRQKGPKTHLESCRQGKPYTRFIKASTRVKRSSWGHPFY